MTSNFFMREHRETDLRLKVGYSGKKRNRFAGRII